MNTHRSCVCGRDFGNWPHGEADFEVQLPRIIIIERIQKLGRVHWRS